MPEFVISPANPIHFEIQIGTGTINENDQSIDSNFLFEEIGDYWNCQNLAQKPYCQPYNSADTTNIQFIFDNSGYIPYVELVDNEDSFVAVLDWVQVTTNTYNVSIDWSFYDVGCYQIKIYSIQGTANFLPCADSGTFETGTYASFNFLTGGGNTGTKSSAQAQSGTFSARIASPGAVTAAERVIGYCNSTFSLSTGNIYRYSAYIFDDSTNPFVQDGRTVGIDISDFSDADTISETFVTPSTDGRGQWLFIEKWFRVNSDTSGQIKITTSADPQINGFIYVDTIQIQEANDILEAKSDCISVEANHPCTSYVTYTNDSNAFGIYYTTPVTFGVRMQVKAVDFKMVDSDYEAEDNTLGESTLIRSVNYKTYTIQTNLLPPSMVETFCLASKHNDFRVRGLKLVNQNGPIDPDWVDGMGRVTIEARLSNYNQQNGSC